MRRDQQIRINELLLQREELFLRIHAAEAEASRLLGEPFPFIRPSLPSDRRAKRKPGAPAAPVGAVAAARPPKSPADALRRLDGGETAYRVTYRQFNHTLVETHREFAALATLLDCQAAHLQVLRVETLDASDAVRATLFVGAPS